MSLFSIKDRIYCITGAGRGIGYELSTALKNHGAIVIGVDVDYPEKEYVIDHKLKLDLTKETNIKQVGAFIKKRYEKIKKQ